MSETIKICDVIDDCAECPRYADDCDGRGRGMTREEAIEVLNGILKLNYREWWDHKCDEALDMAIEALSAEAVQGEWIDVENEPYCECSVCGTYIDNLDDDYAFCPRCGADMRGEEE